MKSLDPVWLNALNLTFGLLRTRRLIKHFGSAKKVFELPRSAIVRAGVSPDKADIIVKKRENIDPEKEWAHLQKEALRTVSVGDALYPPLLKETYSAPLLLYVRGDVTALVRQSIAVVGTRAASSYGRGVLPSFVEEFCRAGLSIVSGLAQGIDAVAHRAAVECGGITVGVLGCGLDTVFPKLNAPLAEAMLAHGGALVSEYPLGTPPLKQHFPARNRIIAGLSRCILVAESRKKGGALITARQALEAGRDVFAIPGPIGSPTSEGTNTLIREGATLVTAPSQILDELSLSLEPMPTPREELELSSDEQSIISLLTEEPRYVDTIIKATKLEPHVVNAALTELELKGAIRHLGGNRYSVF
jgi:DNA processing protein